MATLRRLIWLVVVQPLAIACIFIAWGIDVAASWLDTVFHTRLRTPKLTTEEVERQLNTEIPPGSSSEAILAFLEQHKFRHVDGFLRDLRDIDYESSDFKNNAKLYGEKAAIKRCGVAWIDNVGKFLLVRDDIRIMFYFDERNTLIEYVVDVFGTGL